MALVVFIFPLASLAQTNSDKLFEAKVQKVLEEKITQENGFKNFQQNLKLIGLNGDYKDQEFIYYGISDIGVISNSRYQEGDRVMVNSTINDEDQEVFYVLDYIRREWLYLLAFIFALLVILVGGWKGVKSLISLLITFFIIMWLIVPQILAGYNPLLVGLFGSFLILIFIIYLTDGVNKKSHVAIASILVSLIFTALLSILFTNLLRLSGTSQEEASYLISLGLGAINFKGLFLAAIIIGALGVLDDVVVGQVEAVLQIKEANPNLSKKQLFKMSSKIGNAHLGAVINTLFLAYVGASLPLLLLFSLKTPPFIGYAQVINNEAIVVEIVRAFVGSIGLTLAIPIATILAIVFLTNKKIK